MDDTRQPFLYCSFPDTVTVPSELVLGSRWDASAVAALIRAKRARGERPAFLLLGRHETALLREHLTEIFGREIAGPLDDTWYDGLKAVALGCDRFLGIAGPKSGLRPNLPRIGETEAPWRFRN